MIPRCGRAQLLRVLAEQGSAQLGVAASLTGYELAAVSPAHELKPDSQRNASAATGAGSATLAALTSSGQGTVGIPQPRGRFLQVTQVTHLDVETLTPSRNDLPTPPWEKAGRGDILAMPEASPLVPWPRLWRRLRPHLSQQLVTHEVDVRALVRHVARAEPLRDLPRLTRLRFAAHPQILIDRTRRLIPFWSDQDLVCWALSRWTVTDHRRPLYFSEGMDPEQWLMAGAADHGYGLAGTVVLLLGDLGAYGTSRDAGSWRRTGEWLRREGAELRAVVPCPAWRLDPSLAELWNALIWDEGERSLPPSPDADQHARVERLLTLVSVALRIEPGLLRDARALLPAEATDSGTEADVLQHPAVVGQSSLALTLDTKEQQRLRNAFADEDEWSQRRMLELLQKWHGGLPKEILALEWFEFFVLTKRFPELFAPPTQPAATREPRGSVSDATSDKAPETVQDYFLGALKAIYDQDTARREVPEGVLAWFRDLEGRLPGEVWLHEILRQPLLRAWAVAHRGEVDPRLPPGIDSETLAILTRGKLLPPVRYRLWQVGNGLVVLPAEPSFGGSPPRPRPGTDVSPVGSYIGEILAGAPHVVVATTGESGTRHAIPTPSERPIALPSLDAGSTALLITSDLQQLSIEVLEKPSWATRVGRDGYGLYAEFEFKGVRQRMRWIAPGRFKMGSPESEPERRADREVQHEVELTEGYWIADTACTQALWEAVMGSNPSNFKNDEDGKSPQRPVENVSWDDCHRFLQEINEAAPGVALRLPTEADWEYACRAGTNTPFSFGENITPEQVNYWAAVPYAGGAKAEPLQKTVPVGFLPPNAWGIHEMHGNVWEWCQDWYGEYAREKVVNPEGPDAGTWRVLRGGSWDYFARLTRSAFRNILEPGNRNNDIGFRLVRGRCSGEHRQERSDREAARGVRDEPRELPTGSAAGASRDRDGQDQRIEMGVMANHATVATAPHEGKRNDASTSPRAVDASDTPKEGVSGESCSVARQSRRSR